MPGCLAVWSACPDGNSLAKDRFNVNRNAPPGAEDTGRGRQRLGQVANSVEGSVRPAGRIGDGTVCSSETICRLLPSRFWVVACQP